MKHRSRRTSLPRAVVTFAVLAVVALACSKGTAPGRAADGAKGAEEEPWAHHGSEPNGWWKKWAVKDPPFPEGTRFEIERIDLDGTRRTSAWVVRSLKPQANGFRVEVAGDDGSRMSVDVPPNIATTSGVLPRNEKLVAVTTPAGTFLAGRTWSSEKHGDVVHEVDTWVVPDVPFPIQTWCRPTGQSSPLHLWDPPADGTVPAGTHLTRVVSVQKP
jgi:hypothetical protein